MKHDFSKSSKICIWFSQKDNEWGVVSIEPSFFCICGRTPYKLNDGDEISINKSCKIDINHRVIIDGDNMYKLVDYKNKQDLCIKINRINLYEKNIID